MIDTMTGRKFTVCEVRGITLNYIMRLVNFEVKKDMISGTVREPRVLVNIERKIKHKRKEGDGNYS